MIVSLVHVLHKNRAKHSQAVKRKFGQSYNHINMYRLQTYNTTNNCSNKKIPTAATRTDQIHVTFIHFNVQEE